MHNPIGIDAGGTYIKFGNPLRNKFSLQPLPYSRSLLEKYINASSGLILLTGAGSRQIIEWFPNHEIRNIPELTATGLGGAYLAGLEECIVINIGSGTPILHVSKNNAITHLGGTGMGSASLVGLSHYLTGINDLEKIGQMAMQGDPTKVNLLVSDLYSNPDEVGLPGEITASNFGKYQDWRFLKKQTSNQNKPSHPDLLAGLHVMVAETIAVVASLASQQYASKKLPIVISGGGTLNPALRKSLKDTFSFLKKEFIIPELAIYGTLHGTFVNQGLI